MSNLAFFILSATCLLVGIAALLRCNRAPTTPKRLRCIKVAIGALGSLGIIIAVQMLAEILPVLVVAFAIYALARRLAKANSPIIHFFDKQLAKMN